MTTQKSARLRICASCEWIYKGYHDCPRCGFASYGARYVYGNQAYEYAKTQKPWIDRKVEAYARSLRLQIEAQTVKPNIEWP